MKTVGSKIAPPGGEERIGRLPDYRAWTPEARV